MVTRVVTDARWVIFELICPTALTCSPGRTRTSNPSVNSRTLCQLSYRGPSGPRESWRRSRDDSSVLASAPQLEVPAIGAQVGGSSAHAPRHVRQDGAIRTVVGRNALIRYVVVLGLGYVLGAKAGRRRYEQIAGTYRALTSSPVAKSMIEGGRRKIANRISPDAGFVTLAEISPDQSVLSSEQKG